MEVPVSFDSLEVLYIINDNEGTYDVPLNKYNEIMSRVKRLHFKSFTVDTKEYSYRDLTLIRKLDDQQDCVETKVYQTAPIYIWESPNVQWIFSNKKKLTPVAFPSTRNHDMITHKKRTSFRVNNRIYINFEQEKTDEQVFHKIYLNFNNGKDTDIKECMDAIAKLVHQVFHE